MLFCFSPNVFKQVLAKDAFNEGYKIIQKFLKNLKNKNLNK
jgi:hypothetical protein